MTPTQAKANRLLTRHLTDHRDRDQRTEECFAQLADASPAERQALEDEIIRLNLDFADRIAARFRRRGGDRDDLTQIARAALVAAMRRYRPGSGRTFASFAGPTIRGELKHYFRDSTWSVRPPRRLQELRADVRDSRERLEQELGRGVTHAEIAEDLGLPEEQVRECVLAQAGYRCRSLDTRLHDSGPGSIPISEQVAADGDDFATVDAILSVRSAVEDLSQRERQILQWRYVEERTQAEIGQRLGVSQMQVSRLQRAILDRLRDRLEGDPQRSSRRRAGKRGPSHSHRAQLAG
jgi:RNA polymerase sigma-B factor